MAARDGSLASRRPAVGAGIRTLNPGYFALVIGCHTCTVTCKQTWTNRPGTEYVYFNNVETKPGVGYPRRYEDQEQWKGGWALDRKGRLQLRSGSRLRRLQSIFYNPDLPTIDDYGDPWTYDYQVLINAPAGTPNPSAHSISALTGQDMHMNWGSNWDDDLAGGPAHAAGLTGPAGQAADTHLFRGDDGRVYFNLLGWNGHGSTPYLFPDGGTS